MSNRRLKSSSFKSFVQLFVIGLSLTVVIAACTSTNRDTSLTTSQPNEVELNLVSFSVTGAAYEKIIPKFVEKWQQEHNQKVIFKQSYGGSSSQALLVAQGKEEADVVHLSLALDIQKLERAGLINPDWETEFPNNGIVSQSVVALVTREGNPKNINTWNDLTQAGLTLITPNPTTSGLGRWNFLALWNAAKQGGADEKQTRDFLAKIYKNAPILPESAREATNTFIKAQGDVLLTYESELINDALQGKKPPYVIPDVNFSIDNPVAVVDKNVDRHGTREVAAAFVEYLYSVEAQKEFALLGYRPIASSLWQDQALTKQYPPIKSLATVKDYGGWAKIQKQFFDDNGIFVQILKTIKAA
nr:sulfate ABC transporter substrate-binding protein [Gloeothece verrucosa]